MTPGTNRNACRGHAEALLDLIDPLTPTPETTAALDHLEWCRPCAAELQELALAIVALRRFGDASTAEPVSPSAWPRLHARLQEARSTAGAVAFRWRASLGGLVTGTLLVAALTGPLAMHVPLVGGMSEPTGMTPTQVDRLATRVESAYIVRSVAVPPPATAASDARAAAGPRRYPDDIVPLRKEVSVQLTGPAPTAD